MRREVTSQHAALSRINVARFVWAVRTTYTRSSVSRIVATLNVVRSLFVNNV